MVTFLVFYLLSNMIQFVQIDVIAVLKLIFLDSWFRPTCCFTHSFFKKIRTLKFDHLLAYFLQNSLIRLLGGLLKLQIISWHRQIPKRSVLVLHDLRFNLINNRKGLLPHLPLTTLHGHNPLGADLNGALRVHSLDCSEHLRVLLEKVLMIRDNFLPFNGMMIYQLIVLMWCIQHLQN